MKLCLIGLKTLFLVSVFFSISNECFAQKVSNVSAEQDGQSITISYDLQTNVPCEITLQFSLDRGVTWSKVLSKCSGSIGKNISAGHHVISWNVLAEQQELWGDGIKFRVSAKWKTLIDYEVVKVKGGEIMMGSDEVGDFEKPRHLVYVSDFLIGKFEVTQAQWVAIMGNNPSYFKNCPSCPVEQVSWNDVQHFIRELNELTGRKYRLPTEAEWEYAATGGSWEVHNGWNKSSGFSGSCYVDQAGWHKGNSNGKTHPVGGKVANNWGAYDMTGNVMELCSDYFNKYSPSKDTQNNPAGASSGLIVVGSSPNRICRGGSWYNDAKVCGNYWRQAADPLKGYSSIGFRLVLDASSK